jgi:hypothetical protein
MTTDVESAALVSRKEAGQILGVSVRSVDRLRERVESKAIRGAGSRLGQCSGMTPDGR